MTTYDTDQRITEAREYLTTLSGHKVATLPPSVLVRECAELRRQLGQVLTAIDAADDEDLDDGTEPYCTTCGAWAGMFHGIDGWQHFRGDPAPGGHRELYEASHPAAVSWTRPVLVTQPDGSTIRAALDEAAEELRDRAAGCGDCEASPAELCTTCESRLERASGYDAVAGRLAEVTR